MTKKLTDIQRIVIVGGGAGGLILATKLGRSTKARPHIKVTLIDASPTHIWKPLLHEVAAGTLNSYEDEIPYFSHGAKNGYEFIQGHVSQIEVDKNSVVLDKIEDDKGRCVRKSIQIQYDQLVLAVGSTVNDFGVPGVFDHCYLLDSRAEAERLHKQISAYLLSLKYDPDTSRDRPFIVSVIGGGATGVELAAELMSAVKTLSQSHELKEIDKLIKVRIIEAGETLLPGQNSESIEVANHGIAELNIEICKKMRVTRVAADSIVVNEGETLSSDLHVWTTGINAPSVIRASGLEPLNKIGQIVVDSCLKVTNQTNIYAFGDCAELSVDGKRLGPRAQVAQQQAVYLSKALLQSISGGPLAPFEFQEHGSIFSLGRKVAVGTMQLKGKSELHIKGHLARFAYASLYRRHQLEVLGWFKGGLALIKEMLGRVTGPSIKLH